MQTKLNSVAKLIIPALGWELQEIAALEDITALLDVIKGQLDLRGEQKTRFIGGMAVRDAALLNLVGHAVAKISGSAIISTVDGAIDRKVIDCANKVIILHHTTTPQAFEIPSTIRHKVVCAVACDKRQVISKLACLLADDVVAFPGGIGTVEAILGAIEEGHTANVYESGSKASDIFKPLRDFIYGMQRRGLYSDDGSAFMLPFSDPQTLLKNIELLERTTVKHPVSIEFLTNIAKTRTWLKTAANRHGYGILGASTTRPFEEQLISYRQFDGFILAPGASDIPAMRRFFRILFDKLFNDNGRYTGKELIVDAVEWADIYRPFLASLCENGFIKYYGTATDGSPAFVPYQIDILEQILLVRRLTIWTNLTKQVQAIVTDPLEQTLYGDPATMPLSLKQVRFLYSKPDVPILFSTTSQGKMADMQRVTKSLGLKNSVYSLRDFMEMRTPPAGLGATALMPQAAYSRMFVQNAETGKFIPIFDSPELERTNTEIAAEKLRMAADGLTRFSTALAQDDKFKHGLFLLTGDVALTIHAMSPKVGALDSGWRKLLDAGIKIAIPAQSEQETQLQLQCHDGDSYRWVEDHEPDPHALCVNVGPNFDPNLTAFPGIYVGRILDNLVKVFGDHERFSGGMRQADAFQKWAMQSDYDLSKDMEVTQFATASMCYIYPGAEKFARYVASMSAVSTTTYHMGGDIPAHDGIHGLDLFIKDPQQIGSYSNAMAAAFENLIMGLQIGVRAN